MAGEQLAQWSLLTPHISSSNPVMGNFYYEYLAFMQKIESKKLKKYNNHPSNTWCLDLNSRLLELHKFPPITNRQGYVGSYRHYKA